MANAKLIRDAGRQTLLVAVQTFTFAQLNDTGVAVKMIDLPYGATILSGMVIVDEVFNVATSAALAVGDLIVPARYLAAGDLKTLGIKPLVPTGYVSDGEAVWATPTNTGAAATTGKARLIINYVIANRAGEVQPN